MMGTGMLVRSIPYQEGFGSKQMAWMLHTAVIGAIVAPLTFLGGPIMMRAACYTAGVVGGKLGSTVKPLHFVFLKDRLVYCLLMDLPSPNLI